MSYIVHPAKTVGRNEMLLGRDTRVVPSNTILDRTPPQFAQPMPPFASLLWPFCLFTARCT